MRRWVALSALLVASGCKPPPAAQQEQDFQRLLELYFNNLNNDAELARIHARDYARPNEKGQRVVPEAPLPVGRQFNSYQWYPNGAILTDIECPRCKARHTILTYRGDPLLCSSCGSSDRVKRTVEPLIRGGMTASDLQTLYKERYKPMFDRVGDRSERPKECVALIRFVRRLWTFDDRAKIEVSQKALDKGTATVESKWVEGGYHRPDLTFVSTTAFYYDGEINQLDQEHVRMFLKNADERINWKTARLAPSVAIEEAVRPWTQPRTLDSPNVRQY